MKGNQKGFTLIEMMIYVSLTAIVIGLFAGILITTTRIQGEQSSSIQVTQELSFLMNTIKRYVASSVSYTSPSTQRIVLATDHGTTQEVIFVTNDRLVNLIETSGGIPTESRLSSTKISIDSLNFVDIRNGSSTALQIKITASASTTDPGRKATRYLESTVSSLVQEL